MADMLPAVMVLRSQNWQYLRQKTEPEVDNGLVTSTEPNVFHIFCKIEVEKAKTNDPFVHLRFSSSNKYWAKEEGGTKLRATSTKPEEDTSKPSCTLFKPARKEDNVNFSFMHVQSGLILSASSGGDVVFIPLAQDTSFGVVDWETLVFLPKYVAFKGDNGKYAITGWVGGSEHDYIQFVANDPSSINSGFDITMISDGHIRIKSARTGYYRRSPNWIWGDSEDEANKNTWFWPVKVSGNVIALRNAGNDNFCVRFSADGKTNCLNAAASSITTEARLEVEELVLERKISDITFRMEDARIYDETPIILGTNSADNMSDDMNSLPISITHQTTQETSFSNSLSLMIGVKTSIESGIPLIAEGKIEVSTELTYTHEWNATESKSWTMQAQYIAAVPPHSRVVVDYVATIGKCNVPFSYTQRDKLSHDGSIKQTQHDDGVYRGLNYYSFQFTEPRVQPLI